MKVSLSISGSKSDSDHWLICPSRAAVKLEVRCPADHGEPKCRLSYLTAPGLVPGALPGGVLLSDEADGEFYGSELITVPFFHPLRVRVELQTPHGTPQSHVVYLIPSPSMKASVALVVATICAIAMLAMVTLSTLRVSGGQTAAAVGTVGLLSLAIYILHSTLRSLRSDDLPFFGITHLIYRSAGACVLVLGALVGVLQQCVVVIRNGTKDDVTLDLLWRGQEDVVAAGSQITVVPPDPKQLAKGLLGSLGADDRNRALCLHGVDDPEHACHDRDEELIEDWRLHPFTPKTLVLGCGRRWGKDIRGSNVLPEGHRGILIEGDDVWLAPPPDSHCGRDERATLWYRDGDGSVVHYVRYPWAPIELEELGTLWIGMLEDEPSSTAKLTVRSVAEPPADSAAGDSPDPFRSETRLLVSGLEQQDRGWPLVGLPTGVEPNPALELGEWLPTPTDPFSIAAKLSCRRQQGRDTGLRAVRLGYRGPVGWLAGLTVDVDTDLSWGSTWTLLRGSSLNVAVPWICEAFPGTDPRLAARKPFSSRAMMLQLGNPGGASQPRALVTPAHMMSRRIEIFRPNEAAAATKLELVGVLECNVDAEATQEIVVGQIELDLRGHERLQGVELSQGTRTLGRWLPVSADEPAITIWMCWRRDSEDEAKNVEVTPLRPNGTPKPEILGTWDPRGATLALESKKATICHRTELGEIRRGAPTKKGYVKRSPSELRRLQEHHPDMEACDVFYELEPRKQQ